MDYRWRGWCWVDLFSVLAGRSREGGWLEAQATVKRETHEDFSMGDFDRCYLDWLALAERAGCNVRQFAFNFFVAIIAGLISAWLFERYYSRIRQRFIPEVK